MARTYLVVEQPEQGHYDDGVDTHLVQSAHLTEGGADAAVEAWRARHSGPGGGAPHVFDRLDENECWCSCGPGVHAEETVLQQ